MRHLPLLLALGLSLTACGSDAPTTTPTPAPAPAPAPIRVQVAGIWTLSETRTAITGGECLEGTLNSTIGSTGTDTINITQNVASLSATTTAQANGVSCFWSGTADTDRFVLNLTSCQTAANQFGVRCPNGNVRDLNIKMQSFPSNLIASMFGFQKMEFFDLGDNDAAQNPVEVKF